MTKEEIEKQLLNFSEEDDDWEKVVKAYNLGIEIIEIYAIRNLSKTLGNTYFDKFKIEI